MDRRKFIKGLGFLAVAPAVFFEACSSKKKVVYDKNEDAFYTREQVIKETKYEPVSATYTDKNGEKFTVQYGNSEPVSKSGNGDYAQSSGEVGGIKYSTTTSTSGNAKVNVNININVNSNVAPVQRRVYVGGNPYNAMVLGGTSAWALGYARMHQLPYYFYGGYLFNMRGFRYNYFGIDGFGHHHYGSRAISRGGHYVAPRRR